MRNHALTILLLALAACGTDPSDDAQQTCEAAWDQLADAFPDAGALVDCDAAAATRVRSSLMVLDNLIIDADGTAFTPCVEVRCDDDHAYIASNDLPHYDYVQTTPNALRTAPMLVRVPLAPAAPSSTIDADDPDIQDGCIDAYDQHIDAPDQSTAREPSGLCHADGDTAHLRETLASGETATYAKLACLGNTAIMISGAAICGPNEAQNPDPYGNPLFFMPDTAGQPYLDTGLGMGAALDLCGGHSGGSMHYHGVNEACFTRAADGTPANSYSTASQAWNLDAMLQGECTAPSPIVGWSPDGYPIKGPCICTDADCKVIKRARSSWVYAGLGAWGDDPAAGDLGVENAPCTADTDCCDGDNCNFRCAPIVAEDPSPDGTTIASRCALLDYAWCTHRHIDRSAHPTPDTFIYLDRCNGHDGPDGYAYHTTASFPHIQGCYRGQPETIPVLGAGDGMMMMMDGDMDDGAAMCQGGTPKCCGDALCDGPETADNCPADCA